MYKLVKTVEAHRAKAGGSALEGIRFDTPPGTVHVKWWAVHLGDAPTRHSATPRLDANTSSGNFVNTFAPADPNAYFNLVGVGPQQSIGVKVLTESATRFEWAIQANPINPTQFFIRVKFYRWIPNDEVNNNAYP